MKVSKKEFEKYINFRGIDITIQTEDGRVIPLTKNRSYSNGYIINYIKKGMEEKIPLKSIKKAEFYII